jgi:hypothetical protein
LILVCLQLFILFSSAWAGPRELEVWFLSAFKKAQLLRMINEDSAMVRSKIIAELQCQQMGDFCFDPQYGLYKKEDMGASVDHKKLDSPSGPSIPAAKSIERELISCDPNNFFDIFCGKAKQKNTTDSKLDLWIDTSSSMREMDFTDKEGGCFRKSLVKRLESSCGFNDKVNIMMFDTSIKQASSADVLCQNQGLNDLKRLINWIEGSESRKLIIITDIYELTKDFADFIEKKNGTIRGDKDAMVAPQLLDFVDELAKSCR